MSTVAVQSQRLRLRKRAAHKKQRELAASQLSADKDATLEEADVADNDERDDDGDDEMGGAGDGALDDDDDDDDDEVQLVEPARDGRVESIARYDDADEREGGLEMLVPGRRSSYAHPSGAGYIVSAVLDLSPSPLSASSSSLTTPSPSPSPSCSPTAASSSVSLASTPSSSAPLLQSSDSCQQVATAALSSSTKAQLRQRGVTDAELNALQSKQELRLPLPLQSPAFPSRTAQAACAVDDRLDGSVGAADDRELAASSAAAAAAGWSIQTRKSSVWPSPVAFTARVRRRRRVHRQQQDDDQEDDGDGDDGDEDGQQAAVPLTEAVQPLRHRIGRSRRVPP